MTQHTVGLGYGIWDMV